METPYCYHEREGENGTAYPMELIEDGIKVEHGEQSVRSADLYACSADHCEDELLLNLGEPYRTADQDDAADVLDARDL